MNAFLAAYLLCRKLAGELKIAVDKDDRRDLRSQRRAAQIELGRATNTLIHHN